MKKLHPLPRPARPLLSLAIASALLCATHAQAVDVDAGDYVPAPPGTNVALLYLQHATSDRLHVDGNKVPGNNGLGTDIGILRLVHFMDIGGFTVDPQILLPFGKVRGRGDMSGVLGSTSGVGDVILAATVWVQNDPAKKVYTGITPYVFAPTGSYDPSRVLNLGENRWRYNLQAAHVRSLGGPWTLDVIGDVTWYGKNDEFGASKRTMSQKAAYQGQAWLRYALSPTADLRASVSRTVGGATRVDGIGQNDSKATNKFSIGGSMFLAPKTQLVALWGRDTDVRNGFREESRVNIRLLQVL